MTASRNFPSSPLPLLALACLLARAAVLENTAMSAEHSSETKKTEPAATKPAAKLEQATFGEGCFWCSEAVFQRLRGVKSIVSGYSGGTVDKPTYEQVSSGHTGHAEVTKLNSDPPHTVYHDPRHDFAAAHPHHR